MTGSASDILSLESIKMLIPFLEEKNLFIPSMEVVKYEAYGKGRLDMEMSMLGMDEILDWNNYQDRIKCKAIFLETIDIMSKSSCRYECQIWIDEVGNPS